MRYDALRRLAIAALTGLGAFGVGGCVQGTGARPAASTPISPAAASSADIDNVAGNGIAHPEAWPRLNYPVARDPAAEARIAALLARMTLEEKIGQLVQPDLCCVTPADVRTYHIGSVLNGGNSGPYGDDLAPAARWLQLADEFYAASTDRSGGRAGIPLIWGTDAVHGHSNIIGATLFPHNIGLGAMRDPALVERIGHATAREIRVTGQEWTFAPTVTVPQDFRWGRAYEGYSSDPALVSSYVGAMLRGLQGPANATNILAGDRVIASTKHFLADGGTHDGVDQGDAQISERELRDIHGAPYVPAIEGGVATVMASFSSWQGVKMTGNRSLLTDVLKDRMDFDGFVVSDWNAHGQVPGCSNAACPQALLAGIDMYMAPDSWKPVYENLLAEARAGRLPMARIDDAVTRILRVKERLGLFTAGAPSTRPLAGDYAILGSAEHRAIARTAVRESLVLLKNQGVLPVRANQRLLVAGAGAEDIARQSGGWTLTWQGTGIDNSHFPGATSIFAGLRAAAEAGGGSATFAADGRFTQRPDVAIVVFGERPYAEFQGDRKTLELGAEENATIETMARLKAQGIPVVAVMLTGRPLYVNRVLNIADAFVVAWLPGSEGAGIADVLIDGADGARRHDFTGRLPAAWPRTPAMADGALFPFGYGLDYMSPRGAWTPLAEVAGGAGGDDARVWFNAGRPTGGWSLIVGHADGSDQTRVTTVPVTALGGAMQVNAADTSVQEGARRFTVRSGEASVAITPANPVDLSRETTGDVLMLFSVRVFGTAPLDARIALRCAAGGGNGCGGSVPVRLPASADYVTYGLPLKCFARGGATLGAVETPFALSTSGAADYAIAAVRAGSDAQRVLACP